TFVGNRQPLLSVTVESEGGMITHGVGAVTLDVPLQEEIVQVDYAVSTITTPTSTAEFRFPWRIAEGARVTGKLTVANKSAAAVTVHPKVTILDQFDNAVSYGENPA